MPAPLRHLSFLLVLSDRASARLSPEHLHTAPSGRTLELWGRFQGRAALPGTARSLAPDKLGRGLGTQAKGLERPKPVSRAPLGWLAAGLRAGAGGRGSATCRCSKRNWSEPSTPAEPSPQSWLLSRDPSNEGHPSPGGGVGLSPWPPPPKNHPKEKTAFCSSGAWREGDRVGRAWRDRPGPAASGAGHPTRGRTLSLELKGGCRQGARPQVGLALSPCCGQSHVRGASGDLSRGRSTQGAPGRPPTAACPLSPAAYIQPRSGSPLGTQMQTVTLTPPPTGTRAPKCLVGFFSSRNNKKAASYKG